MKRSLFIGFLFLVFTVHGQTTIYLIPGQGSDERIFSELEFDSTQYRTAHIDYPELERDETMTSLAHRMAEQIDTTQPFVLIGVSLGGMVISEMVEFLDPEASIIISSAKCRKELPLGYRLQRHFPLYAALPGSVLKSGAFVLQPIFEPDRKSHKDVFKSMLGEKSPQWYKRSIGLIVRWEQAHYDNDIIHLHGDNDHTLPIKHICEPLEIENGSHMMTLTKSKSVSEVLKQALNPLPEREAGN